MTHELKILPNYFNDIMFGNKRFEIRKNDRGFNDGDKLILKEWSTLRNGYTGNEITALVDYIHYGNGGDFPWILNGQQGVNNNVSSGFRDAALSDGITSVRDGLSGISNQLCNGFNGIEIGANARQMADMQTAFNMQTAMNTGFNGVTSQLAQCCCDNRLATCQTQNIVQNEGAATRLAIQQQTQAILDKMCQQEIDNLKAQNLALQNQVNMQNLAASQAMQTQALIADNTAQTQYIVNRVAPYPIPAYVVANPVTPAA